MSSFNYKIDANPEFAFLTVDLPESETIKVESAPRWVWIQISK